MLDCQNVFPKVLLEIGFLRVHTYGAIIALTTVCGFFLIRRLSEKKLTNEEIWDLIFYTLLSGLLMARLFYVVVYNAAYFWAHPWEVFAVWNGGLSVHGGLIGGVAGLWFYAKKSGKSFFKLGDMVVIALVFGLAWGRIANFINGELVGRETNFAWGCDFGDGVNRWPVQLIASAKDFLIFGILFWLYRRKNLPPGAIGGLFLILIGVLRFAVEFLRAPDPQVGFLFEVITMGQILALLTAFCGELILVLALKKKLQ